MEKGTAYEGSINTYFFNFNELKLQNALLKKVIGNSLHMLFQQTQFWQVLGGEPAIPLLLQTNVRS